MTLVSKKSLGQFYTTNYEQILKTMVIPAYPLTIIEPFAGAGDMLKFIKNPELYTIEKYDIDPKHPDIEKRDTLLDPPVYDGKFVLTNPPYLARNKGKDKSLYDKYDVNDLYKCFIKNLVNDSAKGAEGGIIIIPLNFWCSIRKADIELRKQFLEKYNVVLVNIFEEQVFEDTKYAVCSIQFAKKLAKKLTITEALVANINMTIYPSEKRLDIIMNDANNYMIGGEIYSLLQDKAIKVDRLTKNNKSSQNITNIMVKCIDDSVVNKLGLRIVEDKDIYIDETPNLSARSYATLVIEPKLSIEKQRKLVNKFNIYMDEQREKYHSLFMTNYRESNSIARKRISFNLAYEIVNHLLQTMD